MSGQAWWRRHYLAVDVLIAVAFALIDTGATLVGASWWPAHPGPLAWTMLAVQALAALSLAVRRRAPLVVIAILAAFTLAISLLIDPAGALTPAHTGNVWAPYATVLAAYGPFYYRRDQPRHQRIAFAAVAILTVIVARVWEPSAGVLTNGVLRTAVGPLLGLYFTARHAVVQALKERAERAERESYLLAEQARTDERARLAGEMHDVVTHRVSLMVLQAGALRVTATDEATRRAAEELRAAGCQALDELRDLVGILRTTPDGDQVPSLADLAALIAESTAVGTPAKLVQEGDPTLASPVVARTAYRIVREALTNVRKHAPGAQVLVQVTFAESQVHVTVRNTPLPPAPGNTSLPTGPSDTPLATGPALDLAATGSGLAATGSGLGLPGLRRRIELVHGTLRAGPAPDGGFCLAATLPTYVPTVPMTEPVA
jgi:signal transduction histidine kinase